MNASVVAGARMPWPVPAPRTFLAAAIALLKPGLTVSSLAVSGLAVSSLALSSLAVLNTATAIFNLKQHQRDEASKPAMMATDDARPRPQARSTAERDVLARFQRDIVPHLDAAYNFARFLSRNPDVAEDIVQDAFLRAYRAFDRYEGGDARAWIFAIVRNCYYDWLKAQRRKSRVELDVHRNADPESFSVEDVPAVEDTPEATLLRQSEVATIRRVLDSLPRGLREMLVLRELEGLSYRQIANIAAVPIGTVMSRLARARKQFQNAWHDKMKQEQNGMEERNT